MADGILQRGRLVALIALWALGMAWTASTLRRLPAWQRNTRESVAALAELRAMRAEMARLEAQVQAVQGAANAGAVPLAALLAREMPGIRADDMRERVQDLQSGWVLREVDLVLRDVTLSGALALASAAEREAVPRKLVACELNASSHTPGRGNVSLTLATIERR